jgi:hypothetical protein
MIKNNFWNNNTKAMCLKIKKLSKKIKIIQSTKVLNHQMG